MADHPMPDRHDGTTARGLAGLPAGCTRPAGPLWVLLALALLAAVAAGGARPAAAQGKTPNLVLKIEFSGIVQTSEGEIITNLASRVGQPLVVERVTRDLKAIFSLGFYQDVQAEAEEVPGQGYILRFRLKEKPRIVALRLTGNTQLSTKDLFEKMPLNVGSFYNKALLEEALEVIRAQYQAKGYLRVKLIPVVTPRSEYDYDLEIRVEESPRLFITVIRVGNTRLFTELEIKRMMSSAEVDCFDWVNDSGVFDEQKINQDLQVIVSQYLKLGYIRVFIAKPRITLINNPDFSKIIVELDISEGAQYFAGKMDIAGDILGEKQQLLDQLSLETGDVFNALRQNRDLFRLREIYLEQGYAFVQVRPDLRIDDETHIVDVTYQIVKNEKAYIGRIEFQGNKETRDFVLRREFEVRENELYNGSSLRLSQQNMVRLGYFKPSLAIDTEQRPAENVLDVITKVEETQTGTLQAQIGYSGQSGLTLSVSVSKGNFLGRGQTLRTTLQLSQKDVTQDISVDFIEPHLFDTDFSSDSSVAYRSLEDSSELDRGTITEVQGTQGFGHPIVRLLRINFSFSALNRTFEVADEPTVKLRTFTTSLTYNSVNHPIFPSAGSSVTLAVSQVGGQVLGGSTEYRRYRMLSRRFLSLNEDNTVVLMGKLRLGWLEKVGDNVIPLEDRFRLGGITSLRGYKFNEVGGPYGRLEQQLNALPRLALDAFGQPVLDANGEPVTLQVDQRTLGLNEDELAKLRGGGIFERLFNVEMIFPLAGDNLRGVIFYDAGQVNAEKEQYDILGEEEPKFFSLLQSVGVGIRFITPLGVFRFEYGSKLKRREGESPDEFDFTISTLF